MFYDLRLCYICFCEIFVIFCLSFVVSGLFYACVLPYLCLLQTCGYSQSGTQYTDKWQYEFKSILLALCGPQYG